MDFTSKNTNKLDMLWRILSLWYICGRMLCLITFSFFKLIETYNNPVWYLTSANLPSLKWNLATWKCLQTELKCFCEKTKLNSYPYRVIALSAAQDITTGALRERQILWALSLKQTFLCEMYSLCTGNIRVYDIAFKFCVLQALRQQFQGEMQRLNITWPKCSPS